jgi:hypothetical protein
MPIEDIVDVTISRNRTAVSRAGFGVPLIMGLNRISDLIYEEYTEPAAMILAGYQVTDPEYIAALALFSQSVSPEKLAVGRRLVDQSTLGVGVVADDTDYTCTINGTDFTIDSGPGATATSIITALKGAIDGGSEPVTTGAVVADTITITSDVSGARDSITITANLTLTHTPVNSLTLDLATIRATDDNWYGLMAHTHVEADILELAASIETAKKIYAYSSSDSGIIDDPESSATDVAKQLKDLSYARTLGLYDPDADTAFPEAALFGVMLPKDPGAATWKFKTLVGQDADALTPTQLTNATAKNINTYQEIGGVNITAEGVVAEGEFIDVIRGVDWLESRMEERVFSVLVNNDKVPFTNAGINTIAAEVSAQLQEATDADVLSSDEPFTVNVPNVLDIDPADKAARILRGLTFKGVLAGAIHAVEITGEVIP